MMTRGVKWSIFIMTVRVTYCTVLNERNRILIIHCHNLQEHLLHQRRVYALLSAVTIDISLRRDRIMSKLNITFNSLNEQREFFLWKFPSLTTRDEISCLQAEFSRFDKTHKGTIDEVHAMMVMDARGVSKSAFELRLITSQYGGEKSEGRSFSFLEICCAVYETDWDALNDFVDDEARDRALVTAKAAADEIEIAAAKIANAKIEEERAAEIRAATIEEESRLVSN